MFKRFLKKFTCMAMVGVTMLSMAGVGHAKTVTWTSNGYSYSAYVNKIGSRKFSNYEFERKYHTQGTVTVFTAPLGTFTKYAAISFPYAYEAYLLQALNGEGLQNSLALTINIPEEYEVYANSPSGMYCLSARFYGYGGHWGVTRVNTAQDGSYATVAGPTSFDFAPASVDSVLTAEPVA